MMNPRLIEHAGQFAAGFGLIGGRDGFQEQENALCRQLMSFCAVEEKFTPDFDYNEFIRHTCSLITCRVQSYNVRIDCLKN